MSSLARIAALAAMLTLAALVVGCGKTVIDDAKTEDAIAQNVETALGEKVTAVECPSGVEVERGATFECSVTVAGGGEQTARLRILNEDADVEMIDLSGGG